MRAKTIFILLSLAWLISSCSNKEESARELFNQAMTLQQNNHIDEAEKIYQAIVKDYPGTQTAVEVNKQLSLQRMASKFEENRLKGVIKKMLGAALDAYRLDNGSYPSTDDGLKALIYNLSDLNTWKGPYLAKGLPPYKLTYEKIGETYTLSLE